MSTQALYFFKKAGPVTWLILTLVCFNCQQRKHWGFEIKDVTKPQILKIEKGYNSYGEGLFRTLRSDLDGTSYIEQWYCREDEIDSLLHGKRSHEYSEIRKGFITKFSTGKAIHRDTAEVYAEIILIRFVPGTARKGSLRLTYELKK